MQTIEVGFCGFLTYCVLSESFVTSFNVAVCVSLYMRFPAHKTRNGCFFVALFVRIINKFSV